MPSRSGLTLVEVAIVLAVIVVLAVLGYGSLRDQLPRFRTVKAGKQLRDDLLELRDLAVNTNRETRLVLESSPGGCTDGEAWGGAWSKQIGNSSRGSDRWDVLPVDSVEDGSDDDQSEGRIDIGPDGNRTAADACLRQWAALAGPGAGDSQDSIVFSPRGWVRNPARDFGSTGYISLTIVNAESVRNGAPDEVSVLISRAGMVRLANNRSDEVISRAGTAASSTAAE